MRVRLEQFFKQRKGLAWAILLLTIFALVFVMPKIYFSIDANAKKMFRGTFLISFGIWVINCGVGAVLGAAFLFFAGIACQPYDRLLERRKTIDPILCAGVSCGIF